LDYKRQEYLYQNIRPFVRNEFKDITWKSQHEILINN
jgi:hypothetical protein